MESLRSVISRRKQAEKEERLERILSAARKVFLEKGYLGTKMRDIALEAELSPGLIYFYFKSKDEIYGKVCKEAFDILIRMTKKAAARKGEPIARLKAIGNAYVKFYTDYTDYFDLLSFKDMGFKKVGISESLLQELDRLSYEVISTYNDVVVELILKGNFLQGIDSWKISLALWGAVEGSLYIHKRGYFDALGMKLEDIVKLQYQVIERGLMGG
jgi:AcrR family transcriptional regulator